MEQASFCIRGIFLYVIFLENNLLIKYLYIPLKHTYAATEAVLTFNQTNDKMKKTFKGKEKDVT